MKYIALVFLFFSFAQSDESILHNQKSKELLIINATIVSGVGTPAEGPYDIYINKGIIESISRSSKKNPKREKVKHQIDIGNGYVLPGFINMHAHIMDKRAGIDMPQPYQYYLWLSSGITTVRDVGSNLKTTLKDRKNSAKNTIIAPRIFLYPGIWGNYKAKDVEKKIQDYAKQGVDGLKFGMMDKETFEHASAEANRNGLPVANHVGVEDMNAWDNIALGTTTIEHWYGIPEAAMKSVQPFPADMNYSNELHRFRYAGRLWREADTKQLHKVLDSMISAGVAWDPTLVIYEASRDLQRAITSPWFQDYLHPGLEKFFQPSNDSHGSFFNGWTSTDEAYWKENYQIWFKALRYYSQEGGMITTGEDAGFIYQLFGFGYLRELLLHQEAGFHPIEVIKHATHNSATILGMGHKLGQIKTGYAADLVLVNGNPMADLRVLWPRNIFPLTGDRNNRWYCLDNQGWCTLPCPNNA